jgi:hypothetical protein
MIAAPEALARQVPAAGEAGGEQVFHEDTRMSQIRWTYVAWIC